MIPYVIRKGDHLAKLALRMGFDADAVWNHPKNDDLRKLRGNPNILCTGDVVYVPQPQKKWMTVNVGATNRFVASVPTLPIKVSFQRDGKPLAGQSCTIQELAAPDNTATTDGKGTLSLKVPVALESLTVTFPALGITARLNVGHLDPADTPSGVTQRLRNLGYRASSIGADGRSPQIAQFQHDQGLPVTGILDDATSDKLAGLHGC